MRTALLAVVMAATMAHAEKGKTGLLGTGDPLEVGAVVGPYSAEGATMPGGALTAVSGTLVGARLHVGGYTHETLLGNGGGVEMSLSLGYAVRGEGQEGFWWGQLDALANVGLLNRSLGPFVTRLHALVGFGFSLWSGTSLAGGGRLALGLIPDVLTLEGSYLVLPTVNLTFAHRATANVVVEPIGLALGAELNFGSAAVGLAHFSVVGTLTWRPEFD